MRRGNPTWLSSTSWANGLARIPADAVIERGIPVDFLPFAELMSYL